LTESQPISIILINQNLELEMSNIHASPKRLGRWFLVNLFIAAALCAMTGRYEDPWLWTYVGTVAASASPGLLLDDEPGERAVQSPSPARSPALRPSDHRLATSSSPP
jgi:hypothetical protein